MVGALPGAAACIDHRTGADYRPCTDGRSGEIVAMGRIEAPVWFSYGHPWADGAVVADGDIVMHNGMRPTSDALSQHHS